MPRNIIVDGAVVSDSWQTLNEDSELPSTGNVIAPLSVWASLDSDTRKTRAESLGLLLSGDAELEDITEFVAQAPVIAIDFPTFMDGRGYSLARLIRERLHFKGELRAVGDILKDQLFYLHRCGFNAFAIREDRDVNIAAQGLKDFTITYQADVAEPRPIYQRR